MSPSITRQPGESATDYYARLGQSQTRPVAPTTTPTPGGSLFGSPASPTSAPVSLLSGIGVEGDVATPGTLPELDPDIQSIIEGQVDGPIDNSLKNLVLAHKKIFGTYPDFSLTADLIKNGEVKFDTYEEALSFFEVVKESYAGTGQDWKLDASRSIGGIPVSGADKSLKSNPQFTAETDALDPEMLASFAPKKVEDFLFGPYMKRTEGGKSKMWRDGAIRLDAMLITLPKQWAISQLSDSLGRQGRANNPDLAEDESLMLELNKFISSRVPMKDGRPAPTAQWQTATENGLRYLQMMRASAMYMASAENGEPSGEAAQQASSFLSANGFGDVLSIIDQQIRTAAIPSGSTPETQRQVLDQNAAMITQLWVGSRNPGITERMAKHQLFDINNNALTTADQKQIGNDGMKSRFGTLFGWLGHVPVLNKIDDVWMSDELKGVRAVVPAAVGEIADVLDWIPATPFHAAARSDTSVKDILVGGFELFNKYWEYTDLAAVTARQMQAQGGGADNKGPSFVLGKLVWGIPGLILEGVYGTNDEVEVASKLARDQAFGEYIAIQMKANPEQDAERLGGFINRWKFYWHNNQDASKAGVPMQYTDELMRDSGLDPLQHPEMSFLLGFAADTLQDAVLFKGAGLGLKAVKGTQVAIKSTEKARSALHVMNMGDVGESIANETIFKQNTTQLAKVTKGKATAFHDTDSFVARWGSIFGGDVPELVALGERLRTGKLLDGLTDASPRQIIDEAMPKLTDSGRGAIDPDSWAIHERFKEISLYNEASPLYRGKHPIGSYMLEKTYNLRKFSVRSQDADRAAQRVASVIRTTIGRDVKGEVNGFQHATKLELERLNQAHEFRRAEALKDIIASGDVNRFADFMAGQMMHADADAEALLKHRWQVDKELRLNAAESVYERGAIGMESFAPERSAIEDFATGIREQFANMPDVWNQDLDYLNKASSRYVKRLSKPKYNALRELIEAEVERRNFNLKRIDPATGRGYRYIPRVEEYRKWNEVQIPKQDRAAVGIKAQTELAEKSIEEFLGTPDLVKKGKEPGAVMLPQQELDYLESQIKRDEDGNIISYEGSPRKVMRETSKVLDVKTRAMIQSEMEARILRQNKVRRDAGLLTEDEMKLSQKSLDDSIREAEIARTQHMEAGETVAQFERRVSDISHEFVRARDERLARTYSRAEFDMTFTEDHFIDPKVGKKDKGSRTRFETARAEAEELAVRGSNTFHATGQAAHNAAREGLDRVDRALAYTGREINGEPQIGTHQQFQSGMPQGGLVGEVYQRQRRIRELKAQLPMRADPSELNRTRQQLLGRLSETSQYVDDASSQMAEHLSAFGHWTPEDIGGDMEVLARHVLTNFDEIFTGSGYEQARLIGLRMTLNEDLVAIERLRREEQHFARMLSDEMHWKRQNPQMKVFEPVIREEQRGLAHGKKEGELKDRRAYLSQQTESPEWRGSDGHWTFDPRLKLDDDVTQRVLYILMNPKWTPAKERLGKQGVTPEMRRQAAIEKITEFLDAKILDHMVPEDKGVPDRVRGWGFVSLDDARAGVKDSNGEWLLEPQDIPLQPGEMENLPPRLVEQQWAQQDEVEYITTELNRHSRELANATTTEYRTELEAKISDLVQQRSRLSSGRKPVRSGQQTHIPAETPAESQYFYEISGRTPQGQTLPVWNAEQRANELSKDWNIVNTAKTREAGFAKGPALEENIPKMVFSPSSSEYRQAVFDLMDLIWDSHIRGEDFVFKTEGSKVMKKIVNRRAVDASGDPILLPGERPKAHQRATQIFTAGSSSPRSLVGDSSYVLVKKEKGGWEVRFKETGQGYDLNPRVVSSDFSPENPLSNPYRIQPVLGDAASTQVNELLVTKEALANVEAAIRKIDEQSVGKGVEAVTAKASQLRHAALDESQRFREGKPRRPSALDDATMRKLSALRTQRDGYKVKIAKLRKAGSAVERDGTRKIIRYDIVDLRTKRVLGTPRVNKRVLTSPEKIFSRTEAIRARNIAYRNHLENLDWTTLRSELGYSGNMRAIVVEGSTKRILARFLSEKTNEKLWRKSKTDEVIGTDELVADESGRISFSKVDSSTKEPGLGYPPAERYTQEYIQGLYGEALAGFVRKNVMLRAPVEILGPNGERISRQLSRVRSPLKPVARSAEAAPVVEAVLPKVTHANVPMSYTLTDAQSITGKATSTLELIQQGLRTSTTRGKAPWQRVGNVITFKGDTSGARYRVAKTYVIKEGDLDKPAFLAALSKTEGWTPEAILKMRNKEFKPGHVITRFERVSGGVPAGGVKLTTTGKYTAKDQLKADIATKFIGQGSARSSTAQYAKDFGELANTGTYVADDIVFISAEGARSGRKAPDFAEIDRAINARARIVTDTEVNRTSYNVGEKEVVEHLRAAGYVETKPGNGHWQPGAQAGSSFVRTPTAPVLNDAVDFVQARRVLESRVTILSNSEAVALAKQLNLTPSGKAPIKIATASEHTDPVWHAEEVKAAVATGQYDALYLVTKHDGLPMREMLQLPIPKIIHFSVTTLGGTAWEPGVMKWRDLVSRIEDYIAQGLDPAMVTLRIDPLVPGVTDMAEIEQLVKRATDAGITKIRFSVMDGYSGGIESKARALYEKAGDSMDNHYVRNARGRMDVKQATADDLATQLVEVARRHGINEISSCGENIVVKGVKREGCISVDTVEELTGRSAAATKSAQRPLCSCFGGKTDVLKYNAKCASSCSYCYAKHGSDKAVQYYDAAGKLKSNAYTTSRVAEAPVVKPAQRGRVPAMAEWGAARPPSPPQKFPLWRHPSEITGEAQVGDRFSRGPAGSPGGRRGISAAQKAQESIFYALSKLGKNIDDFQTIVTKTQGAAPIRARRRGVDMFLARDGQTQIRADEVRQVLGDDGTVLWDEKSMWDPRDQAAVGYQSHPVLPDEPFVLDEARAKMAGQLPKDVRATPEDIAAFADDSIDPERRDELLSSVTTPEEDVVFDEMLKTYADMERAKTQLIEAQRREILLRQERVVWEKKEQDARALLGGGRVSGMSADGEAAYRRQADLLDAARREVGYGAGAAAEDVQVELQRSINAAQGVLNKLIADPESVAEEFGLRTESAMEWQLKQWHYSTYNYSKLAKFRAGGIVKHMEIFNAWKVPGINWSLDDFTTLYKTIVMAKISTMLRIPLADEATRFITEGINPLKAWKRSHMLRDLDQMPQDIQYKASELIRTATEGSWDWIEYKAPESFLHYQKLVTASRRDATYSRFLDGQRLLDPNTGLGGKGEMLRQVKDYLDPTKTTPKGSDSNIRKEVQNYLNAAQDADNVFRDDDLFKAWMMMGYRKGGPLRRVGRATTRFVREDVTAQSNLNQYYVNEVADATTGKAIKAGDIIEAGEKKFRGGRGGGKQVVKDNMGQKHVVQAPGLKGDAQGLIDALYHNYKYFYDHPTLGEHWRPEGGWAPIGDSRRAQQDAWAVELAQGRIPSKMMFGKSYDGLFESKRARKAWESIGEMKTGDVVKVRDRNTGALVDHTLTPDDVQRLAPILFGQRVADSAGTTFAHKGRDLLYSLLDYGGAKMNEMVYADAFTKNVDMLTAEAKALKNGVAFTEDELLEINRKAHFTSRNYMERVMFTNVTYGGEDFLRNLIMFLPAYRQFATYWAPYLAKHPFALALVYRMNKDKEKMKLNMGGFQLDFSRMSFLINQSDTADAPIKALTGWLPSGAPILTFPVSLGAHATMDDKDSAWGQLAGNWPFEFAGEYNALNSPFDKIVYGATAAIDKATGGDGVGMTLPWPFGTDGTKNAWRAIQIQNEALVNHNKRISGGDAMWKVGVGRLLEGGWNFISPVSGRIVDTDIEAMMKGRIAYNKAKTPAEVATLLAKPEMKTFRTYLEWQNLPSNEQLDFMAKHPEIVPYAVSGYTAGANASGSVGILYNQASEAGVPDPETYVQRVDAKYRSLNKVLQAEQMRKDKNDEETWWTEFKATNADLHEIARLDNEWDTSTGAFGPGGNYYVQGRRGKAFYQKSLNQKYLGITDPYTGISNYTGDAYRVAKFMDQMGGASKAFLQFSPNYEMYVVQKNLEKQGQLTEIVKGYAERRMSTRLTREQIVASGYTMEQADTLYATTKEVDRMWNAAKTAADGYGGFTTSEGRDIRKRAIEAQNAMISTNPLYGNFFGDNAASLFGGTYLTKPAYMRTDYVKLDDMDPKEAEVFQHVTTEIDPETDMPRLTMMSLPKNADKLGQDGTIVSYIAPIAGETQWRAVVQITQGNFTVMGTLPCKTPGEAKSVKLNYDQTHEVLSSSFGNAQSVEEFKALREQIDGSKLPQWAKDMSNEDVRAGAWQAWLAASAQGRRELRDTINEYYGDAPGFSLSSKFGIKWKTALIDYAGVLSQVSPSFAAEWSTYNKENEMVNAILNWEL